MKLPPLKTLPAFIAAAESNSVSKAAQKLAVTHSAVSQSIKQLEQYLGVQLFKRQGRNIQLSDLGETYFKEISAALNHIQSVTQLLQNEKQQTLVINMQSTLALHWFIPKLANFQAQHPDIDVRIATLGHEVDFDREDVDMAIAHCKEQKPEYHYDKLFEDYLVLVGRANVKYPELLSDTLNNHRAIYIENPTRESDWPVFCAATETNEPHVSQRRYFKHSAQALNAVNNGMGIFVTHLVFVMDAIRNSKLKLIKPIKVKSPDDLYLVHPKTMRSPSAEIFRQWLLASS